MGDMIEQKCSFIAIAGAPNAGKSTLLNALVGSKVSIVSPKVQTTRTIINGICMAANTQLIFIDTPGIFTPHSEKKLEKAIVSAAWNGVAEADSILLIVDAKRGMCDNTRLIIAALKDQGKQATLVLNKIDLVDRPSLLGLAQQLHESGIFDRTFMVSALEGEGVEDIKRYLAERAPAGPWMYDPEQVSTAPLRFLAAELTRETLFYRLQQELPYSLSVETEKWEESDEEVKIHQVIYVLRESQKKIIIGKGGQNIKAIGQRTRQELGALVEKKVHLFLFVKVKPDWIEKPEQYVEVM